MNRWSERNIKQMTAMNTMPPTLTEKDTLAVQDILMRQLGLDRDQLTPESKLMEDLGADSLDLVEIGMNLEEPFGVTIPDEDYEQVITVDDLCQTLAEFLEAGQRGQRG
jgi:acyl carrier protein